MTLVFPSFDMTRRRSMASVSWPDVGETSTEKDAGEHRCERDSILDVANSP
jgi:hypothetical protein